MDPKILKKCNPFWDNVCHYYMDLFNQQEIKSYSDILHLNMKDIERYVPPTLEKQGIIIIGDLVDYAGVLI